MTFLYLALKFWKEVVMIILFLLLIGCFIMLSQQGERLKQAADKCTAQIQKIELVQQTALAQEQSKVRAAEQKAAQQVSYIESKLHDQNTQASNDQAKLISNVRTGAVSLRDRFTCPSTTTTSVPTITTSPSRDITTEKRGLQREDAEFLVQLAGQADEITRQLGSCQAMLIQERQNEIALN